MRKKQAVMVYIVEKSCIVQSHVSCHTMFEISDAWLYAFLFQPFYRYYPMAYCKVIKHIWTAQKLFGKVEILHASFSYL